MLFSLLASCLYISDNEVVGRLVVDSGDTDSGDTDTDTDSADTDSADTDTDSADTDSGDTDTAIDTGVGCVALVFDDGTDSVTVPSPDNVVTESKWTVEAWIYYEGTPGAIFQKWMYALEDRQLQITTDGFYGAIYMTSETPSVYGVAPVPEDTWTHIAMVLNGSELMLFQDGSLASLSGAGSSTGAGISTGDVVLGFLDRGDDIDAMGGAIADLRLSDNARYTRPFTPATRLVSDVNTLALWALNEGSGERAADTSIHGNDGVIAGATWGERPCR